MNKILGKILWILKHLVTTPWSPGGRKMRIEKLMGTLGEERDICAAIVYHRDLDLGRWIAEEEYEDFKRICGRLERNEITLPADKREA